MDVAQGVAVFVGVPAGVLLLLALPIFGPVWWRALRGRSEHEVPEPGPDDHPPASSRAPAAGSGSASGSGSGSPG